LSIDHLLRIGISACLLGQEVRYDGGHKRDPFLMEVFGPHVEWVPVCPEVEAGMGIPREPVQLERDGAGVRMLTVNTRVDYTDIMDGWARRRIQELGRQNLDGYVLKSNSPSCGKERVQVFEAGVESSRDGRGLFADALISAMPLLPVEDEARLRDARIRERFLARVVEYHRYRDVGAGR
jgi:uncharacterized protein YbbK (DUF523 family)